MDPWSTWSTHRRTYGPLSKKHNVDFFIWLLFESEFQYILCTSLVPNFVGCQDQTPGKWLAAWISLIVGDVGPGISNSSRHLHKDMDVQPTANSQQPAVLECWKMCSCIHIYRFLYNASVLNKKKKEKEEKRKRTKARTSRNAQEAPQGAPQNYLYLAHAPVLRK